MPGSAGPNYAGTGADGTGSGTSWTSPGNVTASDDARASVAFGPSTGDSHYLVASNFGFAIPSGSRIDGIKLEIERSQSGAAAVKDKSVGLGKSTSVGPTSTDKADTSTTWPLAGSEAVASYGGASDLWGLSWTTTEINAASFCAQVRVTKSDSVSSSPRIDAIRVTVYYTLAVALSETATTSSAIVKAPKPNLSATVTTSSALAKSESKVLAATATAAEAIVLDPWYAQRFTYGGSSDWTYGPSTP